MTIEDLDTGHKHNDDEENYDTNRHDAKESTGLVEFSDFEKDTFSG
jgi:hypothetical protein